MSCSSNSTRGLDSGQEAAGARCERREVARPSPLAAREIDMSGSVAESCACRCAVVVGTGAPVPGVPATGRPRLRVRCLRCAPRVQICRKGPEPIGEREENRWYSGIFSTDDSSAGCLCVRFGQLVPVSEGVVPVRAGLAPGRVLADHRIGRRAHWGVAGAVVGHTAVAGSGFSACFVRWIDASARNGVRHRPKRRSARADRSRCGTEPISAKGRGGPSDRSPGRRAAGRGSARSAIVHAVHV